MAVKKVPVNFSQPAGRYDVRVGSGLLDDLGGASRKLFRGGRKAAVISNPTVFGLYGELAERSLAQAGFETAIHLIGDGERFKNLRTLERTLAFLSESKISRTDTVIALGGGVVGDLAGFAASVHLRGVPFVQVPTTLLSMIDSSVGGKTGINSAYGKNLIGAFYQPSAVLIDLDVLRTLPKRELTAGFCEAVKQGAIGGRGLFDLTATAIASYKELGKPFENQAFLSRSAELVAAQVAFKASIVAGDERESPSAVSPRSRKILNFGHTLGHALEKETNYRLLRHGEAVGYGIIFAAALSNKLEILDKGTLKSLNDVVRNVGRLPSVADVDPQQVIDAFAFDKKQAGDSLQWILLKAIGKPVIVDNSHIPLSALQETLVETLRTKVV